MQTVWKVHRGYVCKLQYADDAACWSVDVKPRHERVVPGVNTAAASGFVTLADAECWAEAWIGEHTRRLADAV